MPPRMLAPLPRPFRKLTTRVATKAAQPNQRKAQVAWAWRQFFWVFAEELQTPLECVYAWKSLESHLEERMTKTYGVRAAVRAEVRSQRDSTAEAEEHAQSIQGDVNNGDAELLDEGSGQEVEQGEEPPYADEEGVVDDGVGAVCCAVDVVGHEGCNKDGANQLCLVRRIFDSLIDVDIPARRGGPWKVLATPYLRVCDV
jgi:hypothetical protein